MLADGVASAADIDTAMRLGYKHPMGPLELTDLVGLDVRRDILNNLAEAFGDESYRPHPLLNKLVEAGELGKKLARDSMTGRMMKNPNVFSNPFHRISRLSPNSSWTILGKQGTSCRGDRMIFSTECDYKHFTTRIVTENQCGFLFLDSSRDG